MRQPSTEVVARGIQQALIGLGTVYDDDDIHDLAERAEWLKDIERHVLGHLRFVVEGMRDEGASWTDVGRALGVSQQTAWERYSTPRSRAARKDDGQLSFDQEVL